MAKARFEYEINSKDKSKAGVDAAKKGVSSLGEATQKTSKLMKAALAGISFAAVAKGIQKVTQLYGEQQKVEIRLQAAVKNNPMLNGDSAKRLTEYASALQQTSVYGDEQIIQQQSMLASLGMTEDQIKSVMDAAVDLASSGMMSLESATRNISKSFSGMTGELGEAIPALRDLTAEELKAGKAVDLIKEKFSGMGQAMADSVEGQIKQMKNTIGDIGETIGGALAPIGNSILQSMKPALDGIANWFTDNQTAIINFFTNLPQIGAISFKALRDVLGKVFSWDYLKTLGQALWKYFLSAGESALNFLGSVLNAIGVSIWQPLKYGWDMMIYGIKNVFSTFVNWFVDKINWIVQQGQKVGLFKDTQLLERSGGNNPRPQFQGDEIGKAWAEVGEAFKDHLTEGFEALTTLGKDLAEPLEGVFDEFKTEFGKVLETPITVVTTGGGAGGGGGGGATGGAITPSTSSGGFSGVMSGFGSLMEVTHDVVQVFKGIFGPIQASISAISSIQMLLNPLQTILSAMMSVLGPIINELLAPLIGILTIVGQTLGQILVPVFQQLGPIIELVSKVFVWLYNNAILPVGNAFITVFNAIFNAVTWVANGFITIYNKIVRASKEIALFEYKDLNSGKLSTITYEDVTNAGTSTIAAQETTTSGGGGASYTAGRTINQTVNIYTDVIAGEGGIRDLAVMIRDEIYSAEALGA